MLRGAGLSGAKVAFLRDLAEHIEDGELDLEHLPELPDDEVFEQLVQVKGSACGPSTCSCCSTSAGPTLPVGDLGIKRAVQVEYGLADLPDAAELERIAEPWRPHRSLAPPLPLALAGQQAGLGPGLG